MTDRVVPGSGIPPACPTSGARYIVCDERAEGARGFVVRDTFRDGSPMVGRWDDQEKAAAHAALVEREENDMLMDKPGGLGFRIESLWAFLAVDGNDRDDEGVIAVNLGGTMMPLIAADEKRLDSLRPIAEKAAHEGSQRVVLARFDRRVDIETIEP